MDWRAKFRISWPSTTRMVSRPMTSRTSLHSRSGWMGVASECNSGAERSRLVRCLAASRATHAVSTAGSNLPAASRVNCCRTSLASPMMPTAVARLWPMARPSRLTLMNRAVGEKRGARRNDSMELARAPITSTTSASRKAIDRAAGKARAWSSGTTPRPCGVVKNGMPVASTKARSSAPAPDHRMPLPVTISGFSAPARSSTACATSAGSPAGRLSTR